MPWPIEQTDDKRPRDCPFCNGTDILVADMEGMPDWMHLICDDCNAYSMGVPKDHPDAYRVLIMKWNLRSYAKTADNVSTDTNDS